MRDENYTITNDSLYEKREDFINELKKNYDNIQLLSEGGGGVIFTAVQRRIGQKVVFKKIKAGSIDLIGKDREMKILLELKHSYLPQLYDFWEYDKDIYTVMEYIEGSSLKDLMDKGTVFTQQQIIKIARQLAEVLKYLHESKLHIIHSDIKPANIMLTPNGDICLIDFNISILEDSGMDNTIGYTPGYAPVEQLISYECYKRDTKCSPKQSDSKLSSDSGRSKHHGDTTYIGDDTEIDSDITMLNDDATSIGSDMTDIGDNSNRQVPVWTNESNECGKYEFDDITKALIKKYGDKIRVDVRSDIYSACATLYHLLTKTKPLPCYMKQVPIVKLLPSANETLVQIITHGMNENPRKRFQSADAMLKAINQISKSTKRYKRMRAVQDIIVVILTGTFALGGIGVLRGSQMKFEERTDSMLTQANQLYLKGDYVDAEQLINDELLSLPSGIVDKLIPIEYYSRAYYIIGNCLLQQQNFDDAVKAFRSAILSGDSSAVLYRDYGIALVGCGDVEAAAECLRQAEQLGTDDASLELLYGEISFAQGEYDEALAALKNCIDDGDDMIKLRAALKLDEMMETSDEFEMRIELLRNTADSIANAAIKLPLLERLAQVGIDYSNQSGDMGYNEISVKALDEIIASGYSTEIEHISKAVCLQSLGLYDEAHECLLDAVKIYEDSYEIYKRLAFLEIERQYSISLDLRNYSDFEQYYNTSLSLYKKGTHTEQDIEMDFLIQTYNEVKSKGWLE